MVEDLLNDLLGILPRLFSLQRISNSDVKTKAELIYNLVKMLYLIFLSFFK
jgi:hypothetical protein